MVRPFLSLLLAGIASALGLAMLLIAAGDPRADLLALCGVVVLGVAAASLMLHWLGALVVGAVHLVLGGLAVLTPVSGPLSGAYSPTWEISGMLRDLDPLLGNGSTIFFYSGAAFVLGAFLIGAALGVRSRWDSPAPSSSTVAISSIVGAVVLVAALVLLATAGEQFVTSLLVRLYDEFPLALLVAAAAVLAGVGGLTLRWSAAGVILIGVAALVAGAVAILGGSMLPREFTDPKLVSYAFLPTLGISFLAAGIAGKVRGPSVSGSTEAL